MRRRLPVITSYSIHYTKLYEEDFPQAKLEAAGYLAPEHKSYLHEIEQQMADAGLEDEFNYAGRVPRHRVDAEVRVERAVRNNFV